MRYPLALRVLTIGGLVWSAACAGDAPTAPATPSADVAAPMLAKSTGARSASKTEVFTVDPTRTRVYRVGQNWLYIPAYSVCAEGSGYGPTEWDKPCARETAPFELSISIGTNADGYPVAQISPELRFAPSDNPFRWVVLGLKMQGRLDPAGYGVLYQPSGSNVWINEAAQDPTLRAWRSRGNVIARRLKHFSGYNVSLGFQEQESRLDMGWGAY